MLLTANMQIQVMIKKILKTEDKISQINILLFILLYLSQVRPQLLNTAKKCT